MTMRYPYPAQAPQRRPWSPFLPSMFSPGWPIPEPPSPYRYPGVPGAGEGWMSIPERPSMEEPPYAPYRYASVSRPYSPSNPVPMPIVLPPQAPQKPAAAPTPPPAAGPGLVPQAPLNQPLALQKPVVEESPVLTALKAAYLATNPTAAFNYAFSPFLRGSASPFSRYVRGRADDYFGQYQARAADDPTLNYLDFLKEQDPMAEWRSLAPSQRGERGAPPLIWRTALGMR